MMSGCLRDSSFQETTFRAPIATMGRHDRYKDNTVVSQDRDVVTQIR